MSKKSKYICNDCFYETNRMFDWSKHLNTKKHLKEKYVKQVFECVCSKKYKYAKH